MARLLCTIALHIRNFIANFVIILGICKEFARNRVNEHTALSFKIAYREYGRDALTHGSASLLKRKPQTYAPWT